MTNDIQNFILIDSSVVLERSHNTNLATSMLTHPTSNSSLVKLGVSTVGCLLIFANCENFLGEPDIDNEWERLMVGTGSGSVELALTRGME